MSQTAVGSHSPINHVLEQAARLRRLAAGSAPRPAESARAPRPDSAEVSRPQSPREEAAARARRRERREQQVEGAVRGGAMAESSGRFRREADRGDRSLANRRGAPADNLESTVRRLESQGHSARPVGTGADLNRAFENYVRRSAQSGWPVRKALGLRTAGRSSARAAGHESEAPSMLSSRTLTASLAARYAIA